MRKRGTGFYYTLLVCCSFTASSAEEREVEAAVHAVDKANVAEHITIYGLGALARDPGGIRNSPQQSINERGRKYA